jgi:hypothetical protein
MNPKWIAYKFVRIRFDECWKLDPNTKDQVFRYTGHTWVKKNEVMLPTLEVIYEDGKGLRIVVLQCKFTGTDTPNAYINRDMLHAFVLNIAEGDINKI